MAGSHALTGPNAFGLSVPFARMGAGEADSRASGPPGLHTSPINGLLYVRGNVGAPALNHGPTP